MPLDKAYPGFKDRGEFMVDPDWDRRFVAAATASNLDLSQTVSDVERLPRLAHRIPNGYRDPLTISMVLAAVLASHPTSYIRPPELRPWLDRHYPAFVWDNVTVGRILSSLAATAEYEYVEVCKKENPIGIGRDYRSAYYVIQGNEGRGYVAQLFAGMFKLAEAELAREADGEAIVSRGGQEPWELIDAKAFFPVVADE